jgi:hypothetical protein
MLYVDDIFFVSLCQDLERDMTLAADFCRALMGPDALANKENMSGRWLMTIGYASDLNTQMVYMAERNAQLALFGYMTTDWYLLQSPKRELH